MKIHEEKTKPKSSILIFCTHFCECFCSSDSEQIPLTRSSTPYHVLSKTKKRASISFPIRATEPNKWILLQFPIEPTKHDKIETFDLNPYDFYPKNHLFVLEKYPFFLLSNIKETNLCVNIENSQERNLRKQINNEELTLLSVIDILINYLAFKMSEVLGFDLNFTMYMHLVPEIPIRYISSLNNFSDFIVKFDQTFYFRLRKKYQKFGDNTKEQEKVSLNSFKSIEDPSSKFRRNTRVFEESDMIYGGLRINRNTKTRFDLVLINNFQAVDSRNLNILKEILIKTIYKALAFSKNLVILFHKTFPLETLPEIFDTGWSYLKEEPHNFAIQIESILLNHIFEGYIVYWGDISRITYTDITEFLINTLYEKEEKPKRKDQDKFRDLQIIQQKNLLESKFKKHGLRIFQKVIFSYKDFEKVEEKELLYHLILYLLENNIVSFNEVKLFPFFQALITSSLKSQQISQRRISQESKERNANSNEESSSIIDKSQLSKDKIRRVLPNDLDDFEFKSLTFLSKNRKSPKEMKRDLSFKTVKSFKSKEQFFGKSAEFNLVLRASMDSNDELLFSSYSEKEEDSEGERRAFSKEFTNNKIERLKNKYKSSWSFSFD